MTVYHGDNKFDMADLRKEIRPAKLHICGNEEHFQQIE